MSHYCANCTRSFDKPRGLSVHKNYCLLPNSREESTVDAHSLLTNDVNSSQVDDDTVLAGYSSQSLPSSARGEHSRKKAKTLPDHEFCQLLNPEDSENWDELMQHEEINMSRDDESSDAGDMVRVDELPEYTSEPVPCPETSSVDESSSIPISLPDNYDWEHDSLSSDGDDSLEEEDDRSLSGQLIQQLDHDHVTLNFMTCATEDSPEEVLHDEGVSYVDPTSFFDNDEYHAHCESFLSDAVQNQSIPPAMAKGVELLLTLRRSNAPLMLYKSITDLMNEWYGDPLPSRKKVFQFFRDRYRMGNLMPRRLPCWLPGSQRRVHVVVNDAEEAIKALLSNPSLMQPENLNIDLDDPLRAPEDDEYVGELPTGSVYRKAFYMYCNGQRVPCFVLLFFDSSNVDLHGHLIIEHVTMSLSIFNEETRKRPEAWVTLGYIFNKNARLSEKDQYVSEGQEEQAPERASQDNVTNENLQDTHAMLDKILESLITLQEKGGVEFPIGDKLYKWSVETLIVLGDTMGHDKLCCLKQGGGVGFPSSSGNRSERTPNPKCRYCKCTFDELKDPEASHEFTTMTELKELSLHDPNKAQSLGYHPLKRNAFFNVRFCDEVGGINASTPAEMLHQMEMGLFDRALYAFHTLTVENDNQTSQSVFTPIRIKYANARLKEIGALMTRQSDRYLPKTYFPTGYIPGKTREGKRASLKRCGQELPGVMLVYLAFLQLSEPQHVAGGCKVLPKIGNDRINSYIHLFDHLLLMWQFLKQAKMKKSDVGRLHFYNRLFFQYYKDTVDRQEGWGSCLIKFHLTLHIAGDITRYGVPSNYTGHVPESHFKQTKNDARRTQKRVATLDYQTAIRGLEGKILDRAHGELELEKTGKYDTFWGAGGNRRKSLIQHRGQDSILKIGQLQLLAKFTSLDAEEAIVSISPQTFRKNELETRWKSTDIDLETLVQFFSHELWCDIMEQETADDISIYTKITVDGVIYRGSPTYGRDVNKPAWHDWVYVAWQTDHDALEVNRNLCHIMCFINLKTARANTLRPDYVIDTTGDNEYMQPGLYALVHYLPEDPFTDSRQCQIYDNDDPDYAVNSNSHFFRWSCKVTPGINENLDGRNGPGEPLLALVSVSSFLEPAVVIPDQYSVYPYTYLAMDSRHHWPRVFSDKILDKTTLDDDEHAMKVFNSLVDGKNPTTEECMDMLYD